MIDFREEQVVSLARAAKVIPGREDGKAIHVGTLHRWANRGCRSVVLETIVVGGRRCTSMEALQRFFEELTWLGHEAVEALRDSIEDSPLSHEVLAAAGILVVPEADAGRGDGS